MAIQTSIANSFKKEILEGVHQPGDTYKIALYTSAATLDKDTAAYSTTDEVSGTGYTAGGATLAGYSASLSFDTAFIDWSTNPAWEASTITARGALIYNATQGNKAVATYDFGQNVTSTNGTFTVALPAPVASTALVRIS